MAGFPTGVDPGEHLRDMNVVRMMRSTLDLLGILGGSLPDDERVTVADQSIPGVEPGTEIPDPGLRPIARPAGPAPALVFFHGGAFVLGDRYTEELRCLRYAAEAGCVVVSVDYRLAPEHPFPAGVDDCDAGLQWTVSHAAELDTSTRAGGCGREQRRRRLGGGGRAQGRQRDRGGPALAVQILNYPVIDDRMQTASMRTFDATPMWTSGSTADMWQHYLGDPDTPR